MDPIIWSSLPKSLIEVVLQYLPLKLLVRLRAVSKEWDEFCLKILHKRANLIRPPGFLLAFPLFAPQNKILHIKASGQCHQLSLDAFPGHTKLEATSGGLILCSATKEADPEADSRAVKLYKTFYVCNPVSGFWRRLEPPPPLSSVIFTGMLADALTEDFTVVLFGITSDEVRLTTFLCRSTSTDRDGRYNWVNMAGANSGANNQMLNPNNVLIHWHPRMRHEAYLFDCEHQAWTILPLPHEAFLFSSIFKFNGKILAVGKFRQAQGFSVLQLNDRAMWWLLVEEMSERLTYNLASVIRNTPDYNAINGRDGLLLFRSVRENRMALYHIADGRWEPLTISDLSEYVCLANSFVFDAALIDH